MQADRRKGIYMSFQYPAKRRFTKVALALLLYEFLFQVGSGFLIQYGSAVYQQEDFTMIAVSLFGLVLVLLLLGDDGIPRTTHARFGPLTYLWLLMMIYGLQAFSSILLTPVEAFLHQQGFTMEYATEVASGRMTGFWMILYAVVVAPFVEECLFRGLIYNQLRHCGQLFAIVISALLFGLMHGNLMQLLTALFVGALLAFIRERYGFACAILMHLSNNAFALFFNNLGGDSTLVSLIYLVFIYGGMIVTAVTLLRNFKKLCSFCRSEHSFPAMVRAWFTTPAVIVVNLLFIGLTILSIFE